MLGLSSIISGAGSLLGSIFTSSMQSKNQDKVIKAQQEENEKNRVFNADQAQLSRDYNTAMINDYRQYNDPSNVISRLNNAGLNTNLAYNDISQGYQSTIGSNSAASSSGGISASMVDYSAFSNIAKNMAEVELIDAQAEKTKSETDYQNIVNSYADDIQAGQLDFLNAQANTERAIQNKTRGEIELIGANILKAQEEIQKLLREEIYLDEQSDILRLQRQFTEKTFNDMVERYQAQTQLDKIDASTRLLTVIYTLALSDQSLLSSQIQNTFLPQTLSASLNNTYAQTLQALVSARLNNVNANLQSYQLDALQSVPSWLRGTMQFVATILGN